MSRTRRVGLVVGALSLIAVATCGRGADRGAGAGGTREGHKMLEPQRTVIGTAKMKEDGTIVLDLRHPWAHREIPRSHPEHAGIVTHVGGLEPGQDKPVPPWPDEIDDDAVEERLQAYVRTLGLSPADCTATIEGTDPTRNIHVTVVCGTRHLRLRLRAGSYEVTQED